jgi:Nif-specific regulatory protein
MRDWSAELARANERVPSLAERLDDLPLLIEHFCDESSRRNRLPALRLSANALRAATTAPWPGNIRELEHAIEAALVNASVAHANQIEVSHLFPEGSTPAAEGSGVETFQAATRNFQADLLARRLAQHEWNVSETARALDLTRSHVYNLIGTFGLKRS